MNLLASATPALREQISSLGIGSRGFLVATKAFKFPIKEVRTNGTYVGR